MFRKLIALFVVLQMVTPLPLALAQFNSVETVAIEKNQAEENQAEKNLTEQDESPFLPEAKAIGEAEENAVEEILPFLTKAYTDVMVKAQEMRNILSPTKYAEFLDANKVIIEYPDLGYAELRSVGSQALVARVIDTQTQVGYLIFNSSTWPKEGKDLEDATKGLRVLIANNQLDSGRNRTDGKIGGRNVFVVRIDNEGFEPTTYPIPEKGTPEFTEAWRLSNLVKPTVGSFRVGLVMGPLQAGMTYGLSVWQAYLEHGTSEWHTAIVNGVLGASITTNYETYQNIMGRPNFDITSANYKKYQSPKTLLEKIQSNKVVRTTKKTAFSFLVSTFIYFIKYHATGVTIYNAMAIAGINQLMRSFGKDNWDQIGYIMRDTRDNSGNIRIKIFGSDIDTKMPKVTFYSNLLQLAPTSLSVLGLFGIGSLKFHMIGFASALSFPYFYLALAPGLQFLKLLYLEHLDAKMKLNNPNGEGYPMAKIERDRWSRTWGIPVQDIPGALRDYFAKKFTDEGDDQGISILTSDLTTSTCSKTLAR